MLGRGNVLAACTALVLAGQLAATAPAQAHDGEACHTESRAWRYVVLFDDGTPADDAERVIRSACGELTGYYDDIAVAVATSPDPSFETTLGTDRAFSAERARHERDHGSAASTHASGSGQTAADVRRPDLGDEQWDMRLTGARLSPAEPSGLDGVTVGILDSGVDATHPDLAGAVDADRSAGCLTGVPDRRPSSWSAGSAHGTHVAGIVGAADDSRGITGTAPGTRLASVRVVGDDGYVTPEAAVCGYLWAARQGMDVTNSSFTVAPSGVACTEDRGRQVVHEAVARAVEFADRSGTLNVAAATNDGLELAPLPRSELARGDVADRNRDAHADPDTTLERACVAVPAALQETVTVSAVDRGVTKAAYSSYGRDVVDLAAPGGSEGDCILSTVPGGYGRQCGTSMAAPHVAGSAALLAADRSTSPGELRSMLREQARPAACPPEAREDGSCTGPAGDNAYYGAGLVGAHAAHAVHRLLARLEAGADTVR